MSLIPWAIDQSRHEKGEEVNFRSNRSKLVISISTNSIDGSKLFFLDERNCDANLTATNGTVTSPNYPAKYENNLNCTTIITVAPGKRIHLNFTAFSLQSHSSCAYDQVKIIDGSSSMKYCGNYFPPSFTTKTNQLTIKFKTDSSRVYGGFSATYHTVGKLM